MLIRYLAGYLMFLILEYSCLKKNFQHNASHESFINFNHLYLFSNSSQSNGLERTLRVNIYSHLGTRMFTTVSPFLLALGGKLFYFLFFHMFTGKRLHRLTDYRESSPGGFSMLNMLLPPPD